MTDMLTDRDIRKDIISRYMDAETDAAEEMLLAEYFAEHAPEADETAAARLVLAEHPEALLAAGERRFARAAGRPARRRRLLRWCGVAAAAALALFLLLRPDAQEIPDFSPLEVAESLSTIADLGLGDIESVTAVPSGANFLVTVRLKDGTKLPFIMTRDGETGTLSLASKE